jgi:CBS domain-containing protein
MNVTAKDVMTPRFHTLAPEMPISEAVKRFKQATEAEGRKIFGMLVTDGSGRMLGMLSMYDILLFIQPKHVHVWGTMDDVDIVGLVDDACDRAGTILVGDIMTTDVISITPETHLLAVLDIMIKKHIRRIPVVRDDKIEGIVYISDLFYHLVDKMM